MYNIYITNSLKNPVACIFNYDHKNYDSPLAQVEMRYGDKHLPEVVM